MNEPYTYIIKSVDKIVDGDTIDITIDLGFKLFHKLRIRMDLYDAPEVRSSNPLEKEAAAKVKAYLATLLLETYKGYPMVLDSSRAEVYNRWGGKILVNMSPTGPVISVNEKVLSFMLEQKLTKEDLGVI